ncbi:MAG: hypothetical protein C4549_00640 [Deltaproteobacteria bacterium]|nr:MAG: hypothetical protein C4549_00640 [Deltaproteobacteria bacterium]
MKQNRDLEEETNDQAKDLNELKVVFKKWRRIGWKKMQPLWTLCIRRSHTTERSRDPRKPLFNHSKGFFYRLVIQAK